MNFDLRVRRSRPTHISIKEMPNTYMNIIDTCIIIP